MREFCDWADTIPVMSGTVFSEMQGTLTRGDGRKNEWTQQEIDDHLTAAYGDKKSASSPNSSRRSRGRRCRTFSITRARRVGASKSLLARKLEKGKTPVYNYLFAWEYPINGGITAFHCSELAFCFHALSVPQIKTATGGGPVAMALQDKVAGRVGQFCQDGQSEPARSGVAAVYARQSAGHGVRHGQRIPPPARRQAGIAAAGAGGRGGGRGGVAAAGGRG